MLDACIHPKLAFLQNGKFHFLLIIWDLFTGIYMIRFVYHYFSAFLAM